MAKSDLEKSLPELPEERSSQFGADAFLRIAEIERQLKEGGKLAWRLFWVALVAGFGSWGFSSLAGYLAWDWQASVVFFVFCGVSVIGLMWYWYANR